MATATVLTIGSELVSGDVPNTNGSWLARRLAPLGVSVRLIAAVPDDIDAIADFVRREAPLVDMLFVTGDPHAHRVYMPASEPLSAAERRCSVAKLVV